MTLECFCINKKTSFPWEPENTGSGCSMVKEVGKTETLRNDSVSGMLYPSPSISSPPVTLRGSKYIDKKFVFLEMICLWIIRQK